MYGSLLNHFYSTKQPWWRWRIVSALAKDYDIKDCFLVKF
jgi:hypothetical protein